MRRIEKHLGKKSKRVARKTNVRGISPFTEQPSQESATNMSTGSKTNLAASDLFSLFTADIIKEQKLFTR